MIKNKKKQNQQKEKSNTNTNQDYKNFVIDPIDIAFGKLIILQNTRLVIQYGEHYGLVGKNGIGKTSLLNAIANKQLAIPDKLDIIYVKQEEPESDANVLETLLSSNEKLYVMNKRYNELEVIISENPEVNDEILDEYETIGRQIGSDYEKSKALAQKILYGLGFDHENQSRKVSEFSGGWRMRISLAKALYMTPTLLILDEPTNHLDLHANIWLTEYLKSYPKTVLLVSHDKYFIDEVCTTIIHINNKKLNYYRGNYDQFQKQCTQEEEKIKKDWLQFEKKIIAMRKAKKTPHEIEDFVKKAGVVKPDKNYIVKINFLQPSQIRTGYVSLENISFGYANGQNIFNNLNFTIGEGSRMAIVGKNGVGKSTFLKLIVGDLQPSCGEISKSPILKIGYYNQHFEESMPFDFDGVQYLMSLNNEIDLTLAHKYLSLFGLEPSYHSIKIGLLSGGQKARVKFASFGVTKPHLLVLDEPSNHLDIVAIESLINALNNFEGAIILVTHNFDIITRLNSELWVVENGKIDKYKYDYEEYIQKVYKECMTD
ncbi:ATP binding cassette sub family F [Tupanvirus deep ocean]|uniref:ATP binding cassette sub family F n=2 Tax=Tupanvirus TaxID=2094720 RepID=A0AC62A866_9VIRU|nr:ATP binding cassette sub family F [Tupanvirus deep ocean]QKU33818.1 ATP binding cassette sub family F [Tupanvirus deep ocean]